jgi:DNA-binding transcriptional MerR regulator
MMMEVMKMLSVSENASLFGINVRTLHFYDSIGLLKPSEISEAGYRFYNEDALDTLRRILILREYSLRHKKIALSCDFFVAEREIRTLETLLASTRFPVVRPRPARRSLHGNNGYFAFSSK